VKQLLKKVKPFLKKSWFHLLGKDPEAVVVCFRSGEDELADRMCEEIRRLEPDRRHFEVRLEEAGEVRRKFRRYRIGLAPVLFTDDAKYRPLRRAAILAAPRKILAYNARLERHHLRLSTWLASLLFLRGVPLDRIFLRPRWLVPWRPLTRSNARTVRYEGHRWVPGRPPRARKTVAVLTPYFPFPLSHGGAVRIFHLLREIAREFDIGLYSFIEEEIGPADLAPVLEFVSGVHLVKKPRYREPRWATLLPPEVGEYESPEMGRLWRARQADLAQVEYTCLARYPGDVLVEHDITFDLYAQVRARKPSLAAWWDWRRWRWFERRAIQRFRRVVVMSEKDRALIGAAQSRGMTREMPRVIENGVDFERFEPRPETPGRRVLFIGSFRHFPNIEAFRFLAEEIFPLLEDVDLTVVAGPDAALHWRTFTGSLRPPAHPRIRLLEFVADVRPLYAESNLVVVPTLESAGTNIKVLEALAMERAVVSTPSGCAGLGLEHGRSVWIAGSAAEFAAATSKLLEDSDLRVRIARAGYQHARARFDWRSIGRRQRAMLRELAPHTQAIDGISIRPAAASDFEAILRIQAASPEAAQWPAEAYRGTDCLVVADCVVGMAAQVAGFIAFRQTAAGAPDPSAPPVRAGVGGRGASDPSAPPVRAGVGGRGAPDAEWEILNLAVGPAWRRRGIARRLLEELLNRFPALWFLEVRESNSAAIRLYQSLGFERAGIRPGYYQDSQEAAIVMRIYS
jgi:polysaccharide biosynthesis protein PslH